MEALILVDIQHDFLPGGSLAVPDGDQIIPVANHLQESFDHIIATQDWHPRNHGSFAVNHDQHEPGDTIELNGLEQILWPIHCVQGSEGAEFAKDLQKDKIHKIFRKGIDPEIDSYSGFFDNGHKRATGLHDYLQEKNIDTVVLVGLAADVCVRFTALDALELGYETIIVKDGTRAVEGSDAFDRTMKELENKGAKLVESNELIME